MISIGRYLLQEPCVRWVHERLPSPLPSIQDVWVQECFVCDDEAVNIRIGYRSKPAPEQGEKCCLPG